MSRSTPLNKQARLIALIVGGAFFMVLLDGAIIATSLPRMAQTFGVAPVELSIGISIYLVSVAACVPLSGWLSDRFGARRIFLLAIILFSLASVACGMTDTLPGFVAARVFQGLAGALMTPIGRVLVLNHTQKSELVQAMALITWPALTAPVIGPVLGGFITTVFSWRWNFLINLPLGLIACALAWKFIPARLPVARRRFDLAGFLLSAGALICLLVGLESFAHQWVRPVHSGLLLLVGAALGWFAVRHLRRSAEPLLNLQTFTIPTFAITSIWAGTYIRAGINATPFLLPLLFQLGFGYSPLEAGGYLLVYFLGNLGMKTVTTATLRAFGFRNVLVVNGVLCGLFIISCGYLTPEMTELVIACLLFLAGLTRSMQYTALNTLAFADIPARLRSSAATLASMLMQISMVLGIAFSALILNASRGLQHRNAPALADFQSAFLAMGIVVVVASLVLIRLPREAGAEVSGHDGL